MKYSIKFIVNILMSIGWILIVLISHIGYLLWTFKWLKWDFDYCAENHGNYEWGFGKEWEWYPSCLHYIWNIPSINLNFRKQ